MEQAFGDQGQDRRKLWFLTGLFPSLDQNNRLSKLVDGTCAFIVKGEYLALQVLNGEKILDYTQIITDDDDYISICNDRACAGNTNEIATVVTGDCKSDKNKAKLSIIYIEDSVEGTQGDGEHYVFCPDLTDFISASCSCYDIDDPLAGCAVTVDTSGPTAEISGVDDQVVTCDFSCAPS